MRIGKHISNTASILIPVIKYQTIIVCALKIVHIAHFSTSNSPVKPTVVVLCVGVAVCSVLKIASIYNKAFYSIFFEDGKTLGCRKIPSRRFTSENSTLVGRKIVKLEVQ